MSYEKYHRLEEVANFFEQDIAFVAKKGEFLYTTLEDGTRIISYSHYKELRSFLFPFTSLVFLDKGILFSRLVKEALSEGLERKFAISVVKRFITDYSFKTEPFTDDIYYDKQLDVDFKRLLRTVKRDTSIEHLSQLSGLSVDKIYLLIIAFKLPCNPNNLVNLPDVTFTTLQFFLERNRYLGYRNEPHVSQFVEKLDQSNLSYTSISELGVFVQKRVLEIVEEKSKGASALELVVLSYAKQVGVSLSYALISRVIDVLRADKSLDLEDSSSLERILLGRLESAYKAYTERKSSLSFKDFVAIEFGLLDESIYETHVPMSRFIVGFNMLVQDGFVKKGLRKYIQRDSDVYAKSGLPFIEKSYLYSCLEMHLKGLPIGEQYKTYLSVFKLQEFLIASQGKGKQYKLPVFMKGLVIDTASFYVMRVSQSSLVTSRLNVNNDLLASFDKYMENEISLALSRVKEVFEL